MSRRNKWSASETFDRRAKKIWRRSRTISSAAAAAQPHHAMTFTAAQIAEQLRGKVFGDGSVELTGFTSADHARPGDLTFAEKETYFAAAEQSQASAILVSGEFSSATKVLIRVPNARVAAAKLLPLFFPSDQQLPGIHPSATIAASAQVD